jgi:hypothetical protein
MTTTGDRSRRRPIKRCNEGGRPQRKKMAFGRPLGDHAAKRRSSERRRTRPHSTNFEQLSLTETRRDSMLTNSIPVSATILSTIYRARRGGPAGGIFHVFCGLIMRTLRRRGMRTKLQADGAYANKIDSPFSRTRESGSSINPSTWRLPFPRAAYKSSAGNARRRAGASRIICTIAHRNDIDWTDDAGKL